MVADALAAALRAQGQQVDGMASRHLFPVAGTIDLIDLAEAAHAALGAEVLDDDAAKTPAELNASNDI